MTSAPAASASRVARPALLWLVTALAFGAAIVSGMGLYGLHLARLAGPVSLVSATDGIADALEDSPWVGSDPSGPIVWAFMPADCRACGKLDAAGVAALAGEEMEVRMIVVAPRGADSDAAAALAETRAWSQVENWAAGNVLHTEAEPAVREGDIEWGRASWDRVAAILRVNGIDPKLPVLIWRRGPEWRVLTPSPAATLDAVRRDMSVES